MKRTLMLACLAPIAATAVVRAAPPTLSFDEVQAGMRGTGRTVFSGTKIETFDAEIVGKLPNVMPDQNLILARLSGGPLADTRVLAGMSGSPVFVEGKLIGAVAYSWPFVTEAIAGITPIEEMLAVLPSGAGRVRRAPSAPLQSAEIARLHEPAALAGFFDALGASLLGPHGRAASLPLSITGLDRAGFDRAGRAFGAVGFLPLQAAGGGRDPEPSPTLEPGAAMGLKLVRGDIEMTATGTVTWVDGDRLLGFGHPLFGLGEIDLPLTGARVETLLPSLEQSSRLATPLTEVGALRQDRATGVAGRIGVRPRMIPVRLQIASGGSEARTYAFDVADDPLLSPLLLYVSLNGILAGQGRVFGSATVRLREGSVIQLAGSEDVELDNLFAGPSAFEYGTGIAAYVLYLLMNNTWTEPEIAGVNLILEYDDAPRTARIRRAALDRYRVKAGETVKVTAVLSPYRGPDQVVTQEIQVPPETPAGRLAVEVGAALDVEASSATDEPVMPRDLDQLIWLINRLRRNDRVYIVATHADAGVLLGGARLPNLPPSVATILSRPKSRGNLVEIPERSVLEEFVPTEYGVEGSAQIQLDVEVR
jgi:hypothetical protein